VKPAAVLSDVPCRGVYAGGRPFPHHRTSMATPPDFESNGWRATFFGMVAVLGLFALGVWLVAK
jgi:hypothetical protein